jgi:NAD(P)-dependent dehydrogenase (short-subunit alcohol dehydrogenase family)
LRRGERQAGVNAKTFLVTGASTGIGEATVRWLDRKGHRVFAGVRRAEDAARLRGAASERLVPVRLDVTDPASIDSARKDVESSLGPHGLDGLVNNAGIAVAGPLECLPLDAIRRQFDVNVIGQLAVTQAFLPSLRAAGGRIVLMGSIGGRMSTPFLGPYAASKFALEAIADALRLELRPWGVGVVLLEPGSIATPIWKKGEDDAAALAAVLGPRAERDYGTAIRAMRDAAAAAGRRGISPDVVAAVVERALTTRRPRTRYLIGRDARIRALMAQVLPDRLRDRVIARVLKLPSP